MDLRSRANSQQYSSIYKDERPKIEDMKDLTVRRVLKDNKVPGTRERAVRGRQKRQPWRRGCCRSLGRGPGCAVSSQVLDWTRGAWKGGISQIEKENRDTQGLVRELSVVAEAPGAPPPSAPGLWVGDKQHRSHGAHLRSGCMRARRLANGAHTWNPGGAPTPETSEIIWRWG